MKPLNYNGKNEWKFASATPPLHFHSFFHQKKRKRKEKMYNFEFKLRSHYTQKGILPGGHWGNYLGSKQKKSTYFTTIY